MNNIILTGMPGVGKSTIGVLLAKTLGYGFADTDLYIQESTGMLLPSVIEKYGEDGFLKIENDINMSLGLMKTVIATGGSVIYCTEAMEKYEAEDMIVHIRLPYDELKERLGNLKRRGVVLKDGQTLRELYDERLPLYEKYAHITVNASGLSPAELMYSIADKITDHPELHKRF